MVTCIAYIIVGGLLTGAEAAAPLPAWLHIVIACFIWILVIAALAGHMDKSKT